MNPRMSALLPRDESAAAASHPASVEGAIADMRVRLARGERDLLGAARLVHNSYVADGMVEPHVTGMHLRAHSASPHVMVFVAESGDEIVGTLSYVTDSSDGLPMDAIYRDELAPARERREQLAEVGALAIATAWRKTGLRLLLNTIMFRTAIARGLDRLAIAIHPAAERVYAESLLFERIGAERSYPGLRSRPAIAMVSPSLPTFETTLERHFALHGPVAANSHWMIFAANHPQVDLATEYDPASPASRRARVAVMRARPDVVTPRASLVDWEESAA